MKLSEILTPPKTVAIVGLSNNPSRPSFEVATYLSKHNFTIIPINPTILEFQGIKAYPSLSAVPASIPIDIVDIFRQPEFVPEIVAEILALHRQPVVWMQEGVISPIAKSLAESNNLTVVMDECMMKRHASLNPTGTT